MSLRFKKKIEDFVCERCGARVEGGGFTNHCPKCLWSKHVDIYPGDRAQTCGGMMEPIALALVRGQYVITHRCVRCGHEKNNRTSSDDDLTILLDKK